MSVRSILADKGRDVATITPDNSLAHAAGELAGRRIGALVVVGEGRAVVGILSERDVVRAVAAGGMATLDDKVSRHMTVKVVTTSEAASIDEVMRMMTNGKFRHLPVVESGRLIGVVSIGDVVKRRLADIESEHQALKEYIATA